MNLACSARPTLTAVEMDRGDTVTFTRMDGCPVVFTLRRTAAEVIRTDLEALKTERPAAITQLRFRAELEVDGAPVALTREICTPLGFYEPWLLNGVHVWLDAVDDLFEFMNETHGACRPRRHARFALQDAGQRICPPLLHPWCPLAVEGLDIRECYNGDDCWLGPYHGGSAHGGLDLNHPAGTPIWAPLDFDDQWLFNTEAEHRNNRWRGVRNWPDGSRWTLQCHHMIRLTVPEHTPVKAGQQIAAGAGVWVGSHNHSHFVFKVREPGCRDSTRESREGARLDGDEILLDPWILFWQMYRDAASFPHAFYRRAAAGLHRGKA